MAQATGFPYVYASSKTWAQVKAAGFSGLMEEIAANQAATADPTAAATATATGGGASGGLLAAGTYYFVFTESNGLGETAISPESAQLTVSAGNIPRVTFPTLKTNNAARHLYLGAVNGSAGGPYTRYASFITTTTHDMTTAILTTSEAMTAPTVNSTAPDRECIDLLRSAKQGDMSRTYRYSCDAFNGFSHGDPTSWRRSMMAVQRAQWVFRSAERSAAYLLQKMLENPGTITPATTAAGDVVRRRTWP